MTSSPLVMSSNIYVTNDVIAHVLWVKPFFPEKYSASASYSKLTRTKKNEKKFFSELRYNEYTAVATLKGPEYYILSSGPQSMIDAIDLPYSENKDSYLKFFNAYGTHFFKEGIFGGTFQVTVETKYTSLEKFDKEAWKVNIKLCYGLKKSNKSACASSNTQNSNSNINTESQFSLKEYKSYIGGDFDLAGVSNTAWQGTVKSSPRLITGTLEPISSMIKDKTKRANMEKAVTQYVLETFLESIDTDRLGETEKKRVKDTLKSDLTVVKVKELIDWLSRRSDFSSGNHSLNTHSLSLSLSPSLSLPLPLSLSLSHHHQHLHTLRLLPQH